MQDEELIMSAVAALTNACDGAVEKDSRGWSKAHATTGLTLTTIQQSEWTDEMFEWGRAVLPHYRKQLTGLGFDLDALDRANHKPALDHLVSAYMSTEGLVVVAQASSAIGTFINGVRGVIRRHEPGSYWVVTDKAQLDGGALRERLKRSGIAVTRDMENLISLFPVASPYKLIDVGDEGFVVTFPRNETGIMNAVRDIPGRRFSPVPYPHWIVPYQKTPASLLQTMGEANDFTFAEQALDKIADLQHVNEYIMTISDDGIVIAYPRTDKACDSSVRSLPKRKFSYEPQPHWYALIDGANAQPLEDMISTYGFDVSPDVADVLSKMRTVALAIPAARRVEAHGNAFHVFSPYDTRVRALMEGVGRWEKPKGCYVATLTPHAVPAIRTLKEWGFVVPQQLMNSLDGVVERAERAFAASKSDGAGIEAIVVPGGALRPFQNAGVAYMRESLRVRGGVLNADDMGLGKGLETLATIELENAYPVIAVVPAGLKINWRREVEKWLPHRTTRVLKGRTPDASKLDADVIIINYDIIGAWLETFLTSFATIPAVIADEAHLIKDPKAARTKATHELMKRSDRAIILTGTPFKSRPIELWSLLEMARMSSVFGDRFRYGKEHCGAFQKLVRGRLVWDFSGATKLDVLHTKLRQNGMLRRVKTEVLKELPPKSRYIVPLELSNQAEYTRAETDFINWYNEQLRLKRDPDESDKNPLSLQSEAIVKMGALLQLAAQGKVNDTIAWIKDRLDGSDEKIVVYAWHKDIQQALFDAFDTPEYHAVKIFGGESGEDRDAAVQQFQHNADVRVIVCSIASAGFGVTLTAASNLVMVESTWTPGDDEQTEDRVYRIGQDAGVAIWYMIAEGTIEEERFKTVDRKRGDFTQAMDGTRKTSGASVASDVMKALAKKGKKAIR